MMIDKELFKNPLRTYRPAHLCFNTPAELEDITEWVHLEPSISEKIPISNPPLSQNVKDKRIEESNMDLRIMIKSLKSENICLRRQVKVLKCRLLRVTRKFKKPKGQKQRKKELEQLIDEQELHPVAKAMINLQLHRPNTIYTEEEKSLSRQLYYYSAAALCRLKKAGCNFPGQRTIRRWLEEFDIKPGFCDVIFQKLKEKISHIPMEERVCALKWDEMYIKSYEEYSLKLNQVEGLVDLGERIFREKIGEC